MSFHPLQDVLRGPRGRGQGLGTKLTFTLACVIMDRKYVLNINRCIANQVCAKPNI